MYHLKTAYLEAHRPSRSWRDRRTTSARCDGASRDGNAENGRGGEATVRSHRDGSRRRRLFGGGSGRRISGHLCKREPISSFRPSLKPLEPFREYVTIVSNTDLANADALTAAERGGDHNRSSAVFLTAAHPKQTEGSDYLAGPSIDQIYAQKFGQDTAMPSIQLCIENVGSISGACGYGYSCVYSNAISWTFADDAAAHGA